MEKLSQKSIKFLAKYISLVSLLAVRNVEVDFLNDFEDYFCELVSIFAYFGKFDCMLLCQIFNVYICSKKPLQKIHLFKNR